MDKHSKLVEEMVAKAHNPELAKDHKVYILFDDGDFVITKAGELLWCRTLHLVEPGFGVNFGAFPVSHGDQTCAFVTEEDGRRIMEIMEREYQTITGKPVPSKKERHQSKLRAWKVDTVTRKEYEKALRKRTDLLDKLRPLEFSIDLWESAIKSVEKSGKPTDGVVRVEVFMGGNAMVTMKNQEKHEYQFTQDEEETDERLRLESETQNKQNNE